MNQGHKDILISNLKKQGVFWSFKEEKINDFPDEILIEKVLIYLDLDDINRLFGLYDSKKIKKVWKSNILSQEPQYHNLNKFISWFYFKEEM